MLLLSVVFYCDMMKCLVVVLPIILTSTGALDWCEMEENYCNGKEHIACQPNSFPKPSNNVRNIRLVEMTPDLIATAVDRHNFHRSNVASGNIEGIPSAFAMNKMAWHSDLAFLASEHARFSHLANDECRGFTQYPMPGQNTLSAMSLSPFKNYTIQLESVIDYWYTSQVKYLKDDWLSCIDSFTTKEPNCYQVKRILLMLRDRSRAVGCAMATYEELQPFDRQWWYTLKLTCNYAHDNIENTRVYKRAPCSGCDLIGKQCDHETNLCI